VSPVAVEPPLVAADEARGGGRASRVTAARFYVVVATSGALVMALEILASRLLAPDFGNSVYVWGSIISVFLGAMALGYRLGGRLADRRPSLAALGRLLLAAAASEALLLLAGTPLTHALARATGASSLGTLLAATLLFGPPSLLLATVSPYAVRLAARDLRQLGDTAGRLFALSTAGSLVGTLGCTFVLIPLLELRPLLALLVAVTAAAGGLALGRATRGQRVPWALAVALLAVAALTAARPEPLPPGALYRGITPYQSLEVGETPDARYLRSNGTLQGGMRLADGEPAVAYERHVALAALFQPRLAHALLLGMGTATAGNYLQRRLPGLQVEYVDVDPVVPRLAARYFGFRAGPRTQAHVADARRFLLVTPRQWDLVLVDVYVGLSVPFHLTTREFFAEVQRHLAPGGVLMMNLAAGLDDEFSRSIERTVAASFGGVRAFAVPASSNVLLLAGPGATAYGPELEQRARSLDLRWRFSPPLAALLATELAPRDDARGVLLRDAYAPVESLIPVGRMRAVDAERWRELRRVGGDAMPAHP